MIRIGPVGWTHPRLAELWPADRGPGFDPLRFLGERFGCVEVDVTAVALPQRARVAAWLTALDAAPRTRLSVRLPDTLLSEADPTRAATGAREALAPLLGRPGLGALVARQSAGALYGPSELRRLLAASQVLRRVPLVLEAQHASWYGRAARDAVRGAGWTLAHVDVGDRWDAPPRSHAPEAGGRAMLRILGPGPLESARITALVETIVSLDRTAREVLVVVAHTGGADDALDRLHTALALKRALAPSVIIPPWPELSAAIEHRR
ncbi:MAG: DUF72 domain-containing protein [Planctomycetota bacterium]